MIVLMVTVRVRSTLRVYGRSGDTVHHRPRIQTRFGASPHGTSASLHDPTTARKKIQHMYSANAHSTTSPIPANHKTTSTIVTGSSKNRSYARTILPLRIRIPRPSYTLLPNDLPCVGTPGRTRDSVRSGKPYPRSQHCTSDVQVPYRPRSRGQTGTPKQP